MAQVKLKVEGAGTELLEDLEAFLRRKLGEGLERNGNVFKFSEDIKRSKVVDASRWFVAKLKNIEVDRILREDEIVLKVKK